MGDRSPDPGRWKALALLCAAQFMVILDSAIVILAVPSIERDLRLTPDGSQWVITAYLLAFGGLMLLGGRAADLLGRRRMFLAGTTLFLLSSLGCGLAWNGGALITARVLQGLSAAMMAPTALSILTSTFDEGWERNRALAVWSGVGGFGATTALLIGGALTRGPGWEWIFFLNVPVALVLLLLGPVLLRESRADRRARTYDPVGALTVTGALAVLVYAIVEAPARGWASIPTLGWFTLAALLIALFSVAETRSSDPLVPLYLFRSRALVGGNLVQLLLAMMAVGMSYVVSQYAQHALGSSPLEYGIGTAIMPVMAVVGSTFGQALVTRSGPRPVATAGMVLFGAGSLLLTGVPADGEYLRDIIPGLTLFGLGLGLCAVAGPVAALGGVAERDAGLASGINSAAFQIGGALGVAICSTVAVSHATGPAGPAAVTAGTRAGLTACVIFAATGLLAVLVLLRGHRRDDRRSPRRRHAGREPGGPVEGMTLRK